LAILKSSLVIPKALMVLAIARNPGIFPIHQHRTENTDNVPALALGVLIAVLLIAGPVRDHGEPQPQHDAVGSTHADAALVRSFVPLSKTKSEFRGPTREQCQYWLVGSSLHAGEQDTDIRPTGR
jgi:hypothetical protein